MAVVLKILLTLRVTHMIPGTGLLTDVQVTQAPRTLEKRRSTVPVSYTHLTLPTKA